jgi:hypothetical protein
MVEHSKDWEEGFEWGWSAGYDYCNYAPEDFVEWVKTWDGELPEDYRDPERTV